MLRERLEVRAICGNGASPQILMQAGAADTDLLIAVTQSDETNLCACRIAKTLFNLPTRIARLRSGGYVEHPELLDETNFAVSFTICPEQIVTDYIQRLISFPEALQVLEFAEGAVSMIGVRAIEGGPLIGVALRDLKNRLRGIEMRVAAIYRQGEAIIPEGHTVIVPGDEVFFLAAAADIRKVMREFRHDHKTVRRIMLAGGGNIGFRLARSLERDYQVKLLEVDRRRARFLAKALERTLVVQTNATDETVLDSENIAQTNLFAALTNDDEDNIMAASLAHRMGAQRTLALINRKVYVDLIQGSAIDIAISPAQISIGALLAHVRRGDVAAVHRLRRGAAEVLEIVAHGTRRYSKVVGRAVSDIVLPKGATIGAVVRRTEYGASTAAHPAVLMPHQGTVIEAGDHVIVFCTHRRLVNKVERLFQVSAGFV